MWPYAVGIIFVFPCAGTSKGTVFGTIASFLCAGYRLYLLIATWRMVLYYFVPFDTEHDIISRRNYCWTLSKYAHEYQYALLYSSA